MDLKVNISSAGQFHAYDLARQMEQRGYLGRLYTAFPRRKVAHIPSAKIKSFPWLMVPSIAIGRWGLHRIQTTMNWWAVKTFTEWVAANLENCDVFHHLSSSGNPVQRVARDRYGALIVCDRGSSHIVVQNEILAEEYARWHVPYHPIKRLEWELEEYAGADMITIPSSFAYRSYVQQGISPEKLAIVPYGVDLQMFKPVPKEDRVFRVIYVGAMSLQKGVPDLLNALATLSLPNFELWLIGALTDEIKPFFEKHIGGFRHLGVIPRVDLYRYYSQASVFVMASVNDGFGLVQAQAMACGLPVIATTNTGAEDLFTAGVEGFIVPIRNPEAIREHVLRLYENPELRDEMSQAALRRVQNLGGWDAYGDKMIAAYQQALSLRATMEN